MKRVLVRLLILISFAPVGCVTQETRTDVSASSNAMTSVNKTHSRYGKEDFLTEEEIEYRAKINNQLNNYQYVGQGRPRMTSSNLSLLASNSEANWLAHSSSEDTMFSRRFRGVKNIEIKQMKIVPGFK